MMRFSVTLLLAWLVLSSALTVSQSVSQSFSCTYMPVGELAHVTSALAQFRRFINRIFLFLCWFVFCFSFLFFFFVLSFVVLVDKIFRIFCTMAYRMEMENSIKIPDKIKENETKTTKKKRKKVTGNRKRKKRNQ